MIRIYFWIIDIFRDIWYNYISFLSYKCNKSKLVENRLP
jgi:hypothetical protein